MKHGKAAKGPVNRRYRIGIVSVILLCGLMVFSALPSGERFWNTVFDAAKLSHFTADLPDDRLLIHVIDVGKADAILIESPQAAVLVDTGTAHTADAVLRYLRARHTEQLDAVVLTHGDSDHAGGADEIQKHIPAAVFITAQWLQPENMPENTRAVSAGETLTFGDISLEVLGPLRAYETGNDTSLVFRLTYGDFSMLFCGDMEADAEEDLLNSGTDLHADVLKVAHHGSDTSTSAAFLNAVQPQYAVISAGPDRNNLPRNTVLKRLSDAGIAFYRTDRHGSVVIAVDGCGEINITTENAG